MSFAMRCRCWRLICHYSHDEHNLLVANAFLCVESLAPCIQPILLYRDTICKKYCPIWETYKWLTSDTRSVEEYNAAYFLLTTFSIIYLHFFQGWTNHMPHINVRNKEFIITLTNIWDFRKIHVLCGNAFCWIFFECDRSRSLRVFSGEF